MRTYDAKHWLAALLLIAAGTQPVSGQQQAAIATTARAAARASVTKSALSKVRTSAFTSIQGNALNSTNGAMRDVVVRLRDARFGRIVGTQLTDKSGMFAFDALDPGTYIAELMANDESVLAASQLLNVHAGEAASAVVKMPFRLPPFAGVMGRAGTQSATAATTEATAGSIASLVPTIPISPVQ